MKVILNTDEIISALIDSVNVKTDYAHIEIDKDKCYFNVKQDNSEDGPAIMTDIEFVCEV